MMTPEQMERTMNFILEQQAQFSADMQQMKEAQAELQKMQAVHEKKFEQLTQAQLAAFTMIGHMAEAQKQTTEAQKQMAEAQKLMVEKLAETDERLNIFINIVERHISTHHHNGES